MAQKSFNLKPLSRGDLIDIVAPGSACSNEQLEKAVCWIEKNGYKARVHSEILKPQKFLAQTDAYRFRSLKKALLATDSKAVWCLRGGYGSFRLWPELLKLKKPKNAKILIGLSDITSLHQFLNQKWNWPSLHASLLDRIGQGKLSSLDEKELLDILQYVKVKNEFSNLKPLNESAIAKKKIQGVVQGGNLATYVVSLGTRMQLKQLQSKKIILFFEDIGERGYKVDRFLNHLKQAGIFDLVEAVVFGDFTDCRESNGQDLVPETLQDFAQSLRIPVFSGVESGHGDVQRPLFFNTRATLTCGERASMLVYSPYAT